MTSKHTPEGGAERSAVQSLHDAAFNYTKTGRADYSRMVDCATLLKWSETMDALVEACEAALKALSDPECAALNLGAFCAVASAQEKIEAALSKAKEAQ